MKQRPKTARDIFDEHKIDFEIKKREALKDKELYPYEEDEATADPDILADELNDEMDIDDFDIPQVDIEKIKNGNIAKLDKYLGKYANPFPINVFPEPIKNHILDAEKCLNFPREYYAAGILSATAGAIRNNFQILFKNQLITIATLYLLIVGRTGMNKSMPLEKALAPLFEKEKEYDLKYRREYAEYMKMKTDNNNDAIEPIYQRCIINDSTMEATLDILAENPLGLTVYYDEFMGFLRSIDKYRKGDDMQKWLSIWSGKMIRIDRKKQRGTLIKLPFINCIGTIQTDVLINYIAKLNDNNGYVDRLLFATIDKQPNTEWGDLLLEQRLEKQYADIIKNIADYTPQYDGNGDVKSRQLLFSEMALNKMLFWQNKNAKLCNSISDQQMIGIYKKLEIYALRFTLIMTVLDYAYKCPQILHSDKKIIITKDHVESAIKITEYFRNSAKRVMAMVPHNVSTKHYNGKFRIFYEALPSLFDTQQALKIGKKQNLSERTVYNYLKFDFIRSNGRGQYEKNYYAK